MKLTLSLQEHLERSMTLHSRLCPRQVLGVQMARLACDLLQVDPALERKALYVVMEIGWCAADGVIVVTTASPTNGLMRLEEYGKVAATFVNLRTKQAVRISERHDSRETAIQLMPAIGSSWIAQRDAYQIMTYEQLFNWQSVHLGEPLPVMLNKHAVHCEHCGDRIHEYCEVIEAGQTLCKACALGAYYMPVPSIPDAALPLNHQACSH